MKHGEQMLEFVAWCFLILLTIAGFVVLFVAALMIGWVIGDWVWATLHNIG